MDLICRIYKELKFNEKDNPIKNGQQSWHFYKEDIQMPISPWKDAQDDKLLGKYKFKPQLGIISDH